jgi:hypothetical protein
MYATLFMCVYIGTSFFQTVDVGHYKSKCRGRSFIAARHLNEGMRKKLGEASFFVSAPILMAILPTPILFNMRKLTLRLMTRLSTSLHKTNLLSTSFLREKHLVWVLDHHHHHRRRLLPTIRRFYHAGLVIQMAPGMNSTIFLRSVMAQMKSRSRLLIGIRILSPVGLKSGTFHHGR